MNEMRKLMETAAPLFEWDGTEEFDFDSVQGFFDYIGEQGARKYALEVEDQFASNGEYELTLLNGDAMTIGTVVVSETGDLEEDGVTFDLFRAGSGEHLDSHYWEVTEKWVADQIIDLMGMPLENTVGRRPY